MKHQAKLEAFLGRIRKLPGEQRYIWSTSQEITHTPPELIMDYLKRAKTLTLHVYNDSYVASSLPVNVAQLYLEGFTEDLIAILVPATLKDTHYLTEGLGESLYE